MNQQLFGFSDADKFRIIDSVPYFNCPGNSYLEKLKNRISLDYYFLLNPETLEKETLEKETLEETKEINLSEKFDIFELDYPIINCRKRKERKGIKKNNSKEKFIEKEIEEKEIEEKEKEKEKEKRKRIGKKNIKKNIRQKGYSNKLFLTEQLERKDESDEDSEMWDEEFYLSYNGLYYDPIMDYYHGESDYWGGRNGFLFETYY